MIGRAEVEVLALALPEATKVVLFRARLDVFKVRRKVFAICGDGLSFKVSEIAFEVLTSEGLGRQAPYCAKGQWVNIALERLEPDDAKDWLATAHSLIAAKLTKKARAELGL